MPSDKEMLDWLEQQANERGGILLHDGSESGRRGLGLRPGPVNRTLREAIAQAMGADGVGACGASKCAKGCADPMNCRRALGVMVAGGNDAP